MVLLRFNGVAQYPLNIAKKTNEISELRFNGYNGFNGDTSRHRHRIATPHALNPLNPLNRKCLICKDFLAIFNGVFASPLNHFFAIKSGACRLSKSAYPLCQSASQK